MFSKRLYRLRQSACVLLAATTIILTGTSADASLRHRHHHVSQSQSDSEPSGIERSSRYADFVVDAKTGHVLHAVNADAPRHPASLTKMLTLYILFEELERGRFTMDSELTVSRHASMQSPTKLDLRPGDTISVSDAIHGLVTQSANDAAVTIAENIAGSEETFARRMTQTAHRIGMSNSYFYNASGLPNAQQYTTARDIVTLGRALQERFPENYKVFSTRSFAYHGRVYGNHNHLLGRVEGLDGIKTGYTEASGFNLVTSVHRDGHFVVAAVLGGSSGGARDAQMMRLLETHISEASTGPHMASVFTDVHMAARDGEEKPTAPIPVAMHLADATPPVVHSRSADPAPAVAPATPIAHPAAAAEIKPSRPHLARLPSQDKPQVPVDDHVASLIMAKAIKTEQKHRQDVASLDNFIPAAPASRPVQTTTITVKPQTVTEKVGDDRVKPDAQRKPEADHAERLMTASVEPVRPTDKYHIVDSAKAHVVAMPPAPHEGWLIQIAAVDNANDAKAMLTRAKSAGGDRLASGTPVTETFAKGNATIYRARFAGFPDQKSANAACASLKHKDFACLVIHQ